MQYKYVLIMFFFAFNTFAQNGGKSVFLFSNIEHSPRAQSLGGGAIAIYDNDVSLSSNVPSLLNHQMHNQIAFTYGNYFSDINLISFAFSKEFKKIGYVGFSLKSINYGEFERFSNNGNYEGIFSANDQIITCGIGRKIMGQQSGAEMKEKDSQQKLDEIHAALVGGNEMGGDIGGGQTMAENTALTKKTSPMYHKPHVDADGNLVKLSTKTKDPKGVNHYHTEEYTQDYQDRPDKEEKK